MWPVLESRSSLVCSGVIRLISIFVPPFNCSDETLGKVAATIQIQNSIGGTSAPYSMSTPTSFLTTRTGKLFMPCRAEDVKTTPVFTLNREPCHGQMTSLPAIMPSDQGPRHR